MKSVSRLERAHSSCVFFTDKFDSVPNSSRDRTDISESHRQPCKEEQAATVEDLGQTSEEKK